MKTFYEIISFNLSLKKLKIRARGFHGAEEHVSVYPAKRLEDFIVSVLVALGLPGMTPGPVQHA
jgi:predicted transcriptional regulator